MIKLSSELRSSIRQYVSSHALIDIHAVHKFVSPVLTITTDLAWFQVYPFCQFVNKYSHCIMTILSLRKSSNIVCCDSMPSVWLYTEGSSSTSCLEREGLVYLTARTVGNVVSTVLMYVVPVKVSLYSCNGSFDTQVTSIWSFIHVPEDKASNMS